MTFFGTPAGISAPPQTRNSIGITTVYTAPASSYAVLTLELNTTFVSGTLVEASFLINGVVVFRTRLTSASTVSETYTSVLLGPNQVLAVELSLVGPATGSVIASATGVEFLV